ncbi:hypothetical protein O1O06_11835 [Grimontia hollisae]|uniref:hypothetical protein n=1 Tax=Grimontia hollisae TaxID=673 RepID=UPI0023DCE9F4|nr:hypothetical protein [Grimontia hollisae]MDF2185453.1 hypothetical protein [Grimontia hollisae]
MARETIGHVKCPIAGDMAEVRQDKRGKLYYLGEAGMIKPNLPRGQAWLERHMIPLSGSQPDKESRDDDGGFLSALWG